MSRAAKGPEGRSPAVGVELYNAMSRRIVRPVGQADGQRILHAPKYRLCLVFTAYFTSFGTMEPILNPEEMLFMSELNGNDPGWTSDELQESDWPVLESQLQSCCVATRGQSGTSHSAAATSTHPLVPLLLYSDRHLPRPAPYNQPISEPASPPCWTRPCYHSDSPVSRSVKKPLNAFMLYMKETRHQVLLEGREKESSAINRILGRRWNALPRSEQSRFYELARKERLLHMQLHPGWSARDNYGKRKRRRGQQQTEGGPSRSEVVFHQF